MQIIKNNDKTYIPPSSIQHLANWIKKINKYQIIKETKFIDKAKYRL